MTETIKFVNVGSDIYFRPSVTTPYGLLCDMTAEKVMLVNENKSFSGVVD